MIDRRIFTGTVPRYELKIHEISPEDILPNGDRYIVEVIDLDEKVEFGSLLIVTQNQPDRPGDPTADPTIERRGVIAAVVVSVGNGHLLGLPDHPAKDGRERHDPLHWASVPQFFSEGDVVFLDHNAKGRALKIVGREIRVCNQIDILCSIPKLKLRRVEDGSWEPING